MPQLEHIEAIEKRLWSAADTLRANSGLASNEYFLPVMGLVFLRHAYSRYLAVKSDIEASLPTRDGVRRAPRKEDFSRKSAIYLRPEAQFDYLVSLPDGADRAAAIIAAMQSIEEDYDALSGNLPKDEYRDLGNGILGELLRALNPEELKHVSGDIFGRIYEYFLTQFAGEKAHDGGEFFTPISLVSFIANVLEPESGIVLDPACGSGGMFVQSASIVERHNASPAERLTFCGMEKNATTIRLAKMNLAVHGLEGDIQQANTYYDDPHELCGRADFVMANPPFNVDEIDADAVRRDPRLPFGVPSINKKGKVSNGNYVWINYFYGYLNETGRAGFVMSSQASSAGGGEAEVRQSLVESGAVDIMVAIRSNFFYTRTVPCELWFLNRAKPKQHEDKVLMLDARGIWREVTRTIYDFSSEQEQNLLAIIWLYRGQTDRYLELLAARCCLVPQRAAACFEAGQGEEAASLPAYIAAIEAVRQLAAPSAPATTLEELDTALKTFQEGADKLRHAAAAEQGACASLPLENTALLAAIQRLAPLADIARTLAADAERLQRSAAALLDACKDAADWNTRTANRARKAAEAARDCATEQLAAVHDIHTHARWLAERFPEAALRDIPGLVKLVSIDEIEANDWSLTPGRYVGVAPEDQTDAASFAEEMLAIHSELRTLDQQAAALAAKIQTNFAGLAL